MKMEKKKIEGVLLVLAMLFSSLLIFQEIPTVKANQVEDAINLGLDWLDSMAYLEINSTHAVALEGPTLGFRIHRSDGYWTIFGKKDEWTGNWPNTEDSNLPPSATMIRGGCQDPQGTTDDLGLITGAIDRQRFKYFFDIDGDGNYNDVVLYIEYATMTNTNTRVAGKVVNYVDKGLTLSLQLETTEVLPTITLNAQFSIDKQGGWAGRRYTIRPTTKGLADLYVWLATTQYPWLNGRTYQQVRGVNYADRALKLYRTWYGSGYIIDRFDGMYGATVNVRPWAGQYGIPNYPPNPDLIVEPWYLTSSDTDAYIDNNNKTAGWYNYGNLPDSDSFRSQRNIARFATVSRTIMPDDTEWNNLPFKCSDTEFVYAYKSRTGFNYARNQYIANGFEFDLLHYNDLPAAIPGADVILGIGTDAKSIRACHDMYKYGANVPYGLATLKSEFIDSAQWDGNGIARDDWHGTPIGWVYPAYGTHNTATYANALIQYYKLTNDLSCGSRADEVIGVLLMLQNKLGVPRYSRARDTSMYRAEYVGSFLPGYAVAYSFGQQDIYSASWTDAIYGFLNSTGIFREDPQATAYPVIGNTECTIPSVWALIQYRTTNRTPVSPSQSDYSLTCQSNAVAYTDHGGSLGGDGSIQIVSSNVQSTYLGGQTGNLYQHTGKLNRLRIATYSNAYGGEGWASIEYQWNFSLSNPVTNWRAKVYFTIPDLCGMGAGGNSLTVTASLYNSGGQLITQESKVPINGFKGTTHGNALNAKMIIYENLIPVSSLSPGSYTVKLKFLVHSGGSSSILNLGYLITEYWPGLPMGIEYFGYDMDEIPYPSQILTVQSASGGYTIPATGSHGYQHNQQVTITAYATSGYNFNHWHINGTDAGTTNPKTITMDNNYIIQPQFTAIPFQVTVTNGGHGSTTPSGTANYQYGTRLTLYSTPEAGYRFDHWTATGSISLDNPNAQYTTATINSAGTITAYFTALPTYSVTFTVSGSGSTSPSGTHTYYEGQTIMISATAGENYEFSAWSKNGNVDFWDCLSPTTGVEIHGTATITANFIQSTWYQTTCNAYATWDGYTYYYYGQSALWKTSGWHWLTFGSCFVEAYNYKDDTWHYSDPDWYDLGTGTTLDVYYDLSGS